MPVEGPSLAASRTATQTVSTAITASGRISFAKIREPLEVPDLLALQTESFDWLLGNERWQARVAEAKAAGRGDVPDLSGTSPRPAALASATRACQRSLPSSQSKLSVCRARRSGTSRGSRIFAKEIRPEAVIAVETVWVAVREAAKDGPSTGILKLKVQRYRANTFSARRHRSDKAVGAVPEGSTEATRRNMRQRKATAYL